VAHSLATAAQEPVAVSAPDYDAPEVLVVREREQLRALADDLRAGIIVLLRERARSVTELAGKLGLPKGTVGHHVKVLEKAGLVRVVRTRRVRAVTERYYGRTARLFLFENPDDEDGQDVRGVAAAGLRAVADEIRSATDEGHSVFGVLRVRLNDDDAQRFLRRLEKLQDDVRAADDRGGRPYTLASAYYERGDV
jgi:DNA-binding transcriptional ArsR family regulator